MLVMVDFLLVFVMLILSVLLLNSDVSIVVWVVCV